MKRREFLMFVGGVAASPLVARTQPAKTVLRQGQPLRRVGFLLDSADDAEGETRLGIFRESLASAGWQDGRNVSIDIAGRGLDGNTHASLVSLADRLTSNH